MGLVLIMVLVLLFVLSVFVTGVLVGGVIAAPHVLIVLCLFLVLVGLAILVINPKEKIIILWICHLLFLQEIFYHIVLVLVFVSVVVPIVLFLRFLVLILVLILLLFLSVFVTDVLVGGVMAAPHVLSVLCFFLVLVGLAILVINPKEKNNNFMDLSPFVFTRNILPYSHISGLCVCGCSDCLIPPFPRTDNGPCPLICPECFCHW